MPRTPSFLVSLKTPQWKLDYNKRHRKKYRSEIHEQAYMTRHYGKKWWLRLAWIKTGGNAAEWPIKKPRYL